MGAGKEGVRRKFVRGGRRAGRRNLRRGRTGDAAPEVVEDPPTDDEAEAKEAGEEEVPEWCDPTKPMGAWLNYAKIRAICSERGFTDFGPYGGVPAGEDEEAATEAPLEE